MERLKDYYADKVILLTGGTGLLGKVLIESLLRQLPDVGKIYVLIRPKTRSGGSVVSSEERLFQEVQGSEAFSLLRKQHGEAFPRLFREKVKAVPGDLSLDQLGLDRETYLRLQREVQVIINCAAVVTFDAPIDDAIRLNSLGPQRLLEFARGCVDPVVAHVSTCYVNGTRKGPIPEEPLDPKRTVGQINGLRQKPYDVEEELAAITARVKKIRRPLPKAEEGTVSDGRQVDLVRSREETEQDEHRVAQFGMSWAHSRGWYDVYTFTKAMGEQMFVRHLGDVRGAIIRPAIIESIWRSPDPGWLNGFRMLDPLIVAYGRGRMPDFPGNANGILDIIPVDVVANALLAITARIESGNQHLVYQIASGMENPLTLQGFADQVDDYFQKYPLISQPDRQGKGKVLRKPTFPSTRRFLRRLKYRYIVPAHIAETLATTLSFNAWGRRLKGEYKMKLSGLERLRQYARLYGPYAENDCQFLTNNTREVWGSLSPEDQRDFPFDISQLDWRSYLQEVHIPGVKKYLLGMPWESPAPASRKEAELVATKASGPRETATPTAALASKERHPDLTGPSGAPAPHMGQHIRGSNLTDSLLHDLPGIEEVDQWIHLGLFDRAFSKMAWVPADLVFRYWTGFECEGLENIPSKDPFIVASNHNSHLDTPVVFHALGERSKNLYTAAARDYFFKNPLFGWFAHATCRAVPFDREGPVTDGLGLALGILKKGHSLIFFPEGGRGRPGEIQPFKSGIGILALAAGVPVVPTYIDGTFESMPKGSKLPKRRRVTVRFGPPISIDARLNELDSKGLAEQCRAFTSEVQRAVEALDVTG